MSAFKPCIVVAITGGSGILYSLDLLKTLRYLPVETHLIITNGAKQVIPTELDEGVAELEELVDVIHKDSNLGASISSGSFQTQGMIIAPCSAGTLAKVAQGFTDNLVSRVAHVHLKEKRPLILVLREAPYSRPLIQNMLAANDAGAIILPASPNFYHKPKTISDLIATITARALDLLGIANAKAKRWEGNP